MSLLDKTLFVICVVRQQLKQALPALVSTCAPIADPEAMPIHCEKNSEK